MYVNTCIKMNEPKPTSQKLDFIYFILSGIFIANVLLAELLGMKVFSLSDVLRSLPFFHNHTGDLKMSVGILIWPFVFVLSDIVNEYFGKKGVRRMSILSAAIIIYTSIIVMVSTSLPPAKSWLEHNSIDMLGHTLNINQAYLMIFRQGVAIIIGSVIAFILGQLIDVYAFHYIRKITGHRWLWLRATGSTVISQLIDSYVVLLVAFYLMGKWTFHEILILGTIQYIYKVSLAVLLTPVVYLVHSMVDNYIGKSGAQEVIEETNKHWSR